MQTDQQTILIITNGDSAVRVMQEAGIPGDYLPWRDVLHDGPVPADLDFAALAELRKGFIISQGWGRPEDIQHSFAERNGLLQSFNNYQKVQLWFEHDLYDQLQILQLLDWFSQQNTENTTFSMICTEHYLGLYTPEEVRSLLKYEMPISQEQIRLAKKAWAAFRSPTPQQWRALLDQDTSALPYLKAAVLRLLEEYPSTSDGLGRTGRTALQIIASDEHNLWRVFERYQETEQRRFMGDSSFWTILDDMLASTPPCLRLQNGESLKQPVQHHDMVNITPTGQDLLDGKINWLDLHQIDRWIGGVHLKPDSLWLWNDDLQQVVQVMTDHPETEC